MSEEDPMVAAVEEWLAEHSGDWQARATAAEAREAKLRERAQALLDHIGPENSRVYANDVPVRLLRAAIEESQRG